jgi:hypothetical protein
VNIATDSFQLSGTTQASNTWAGQAILSLLNSSTNTWTESHVLVPNVSTSNARLGMGGGSKSLSATLDRVRITTTGTNTFDAGTINILYE